MTPGLTAFTRMRRSFKSVVNVRANERTAAFVAQLTLFAGGPLLAPMDAFRMIEAPSGSSGSAFCTVKSTPLHVDAEDRVVQLLGDRAQGRKLHDAGIGEDKVEPALLPRDLCEEAIEVAEVRHVSLDAGHIASDLLDRRRRLGLTAPGDEDVGAFLHEPLRRRETDAAVATRDECD